jgi:hypothetical protein
MKTKRTDVTIETDEVWIIRRLRDMSVDWRPGSGEQVGMITPDEAALLTEPDARAIYRQAEARVIHYREMPEGFLLIWLKSIWRWSKLIRHIWR